MLLYIDPGTGSMLFTILIGVIGASIYSLRMLFIKLRFKLSGGKIPLAHHTAGAFDTGQNFKLFCTQGLFCCFVHNIPSLSKI